MYKIITNSIYALFIILNAGCASKIYTSPSLDFIVKDGLDKQRIEGIKLTVGPTSDESLIATSNSNGEVKVDSIYELKFHFYPFPIPTQGMTLPAIFNIRHKTYSDYNVSCLFTSLGSGECSPVFVENLIAKKPLIFECKTCCTYKTIAGHVNVLKNGSKTQYQFTIENSSKKNVATKYHEIIFSELNNQQIEMIERSEKFYIDILSNGSCKKIRLPYD